MGLIKTISVHYLRRGEQGEKGAVLRGPQYWDDVDVGYSFQSGSSGETYKDVVIYNDNFYSCVTSHTKTDSNYPTSAAAVNGGLWQLGDKLEMVAAQVLLAANAKIRFASTNSLTILDADGNVCAGLSGSQDGSKTRIWAGLVNGKSDPDNAPFRVDESGNLYAESATIKGTIYASAGYIGGFAITGAESGYMEATSGNNSMYLASDSIIFTYTSSNTSTTNDKRERYVYVGTDAYPATTGGYVACPMYVRADRAVSNSYYGNVGITLDVKGSAYLNDTTSYMYSGNFALYILSGRIAGFRLKARRVSASGTLSTMDSIIFTTATSEITLTLPSGAEDGHVLFVRKCAAGNVNFSGTIKSSYSSTTTSVTLKGSDLCVLIYNATWGYWTANSFSEEG